jgi:tripeptidyl-peptidase I
VIGNSVDPIELTFPSSHHASPNYGKHYTSEEVVELFKPSDSAVESVRVWLTNAGIASDRISQSANKQWIQFDGTIKELEGLLHTEYHVFEHERTGLQDVATEK